MPVPPKPVHQVLVHPKQIHQSVVPKCGPCPPRSHRSEECRGLILDSVLLMHKTSHLRKEDNILETWSLMIEHLQVYMGPSVQSNQFQVSSDQRVRGRPILRQSSDRSYASRVLFSSGTTTFTYIEGHYRDQCIHMYTLIFKG